MKWVIGKSKYRIIPYAHFVNFVVYVCAYTLVDIKR